MPRFDYRALLAITAGALSASLAISAVAHAPVNPPAASPDRVIDFPDTAKYKTLSVDLHTHTVFSDGHVWPTIRVEEAARDGLDAYAVTEHVEWQPHITDIPHPDRNRAFEESARAAKDLDLKVIPGAEITRRGDPGHVNAVFITDANALVQQRPEQKYMPEHLFATKEEALELSAQSSPEFRSAHEVTVDGEVKWAPYASKDWYFTLVNYAYADARPAREVLQAANDQGAFTFWNHPNFESNNASLNPFHKKTVKDGLLHGIEIANGDRYYENAHRLALKHNLALIGVSDVHNLIAWDYRPEAKDNPGHRPVTLVLAETDSLEGIKQGLFARRTVVWWKNTLIGRKAHLEPLLQAMVSVESNNVMPWGVQLQLRNNSDAQLLLRNESKHGIRTEAPHITLAANGVTTVKVEMDKPSADAKLSFSVLNALVAPRRPATLRLVLPNE